MTSVKTMLDDPISYSKQRSVYRLNAGTKINTKKIRLLDFKLLRIKNNAPEPYLFGSGGSVEMIKKVSVTSLDGVEIDRASGYGLYFQNLKSALASNSIQYGINSLLGHNLDLSVLCPDFAEVVNGHPYDAENTYWNMNNQYQTINISGLMQYLSVARSVSDEGLELVIEWNFDAMERDGSTFYFETQPKLAYDVYLDATPVDIVPAKSGYIYYSMATESFPITAGNPLERIDRKLTSYNKQYIQNMYYFLKNGEDFSQGSSLHLSTLQPSYFLSEAPAHESMQLVIDGLSLFSKKAITLPALKQSIFNDQFNTANIPAGSNVDLEYPMDLVTDGRFSYGVLPVNRFVSDELVLQYFEDKAHTLSSAVILIAETLRGYIPSQAMTYFVNL